MKFSGKSGKFSPRGQKHPEFDPCTQHSFPPFTENLGSNFGVFFRNFRDLEFSRKTPRFCTCAHVKNTLFRLYTRGRWHPRFSRSFPEVGNFAGIFQNFPKFSKIFRNFQKFRKTWSKFTWNLHLVCTPHSDRSKAIYTLISGSKFRAREIFPRGEIQKISTSEFLWHAQNLQLIHNLYSDRSKAICT